MVAILQAKGLASWAVSVSFMLYQRMTRRERPSPFEVKGYGWLSGPRVHPSFPPVTSALWHTQAAGCDQRHTPADSNMSSHAGRRCWLVGVEEGGESRCFHERFLLEWIMKEWTQTLRIGHITMGTWLQKIHKATWQFQGPQLWARFSKKRKAVPFSSVRLHLILNIWKPLSAEQQSSWNIFEMGLFFFPMSICFIFPK